MQRRSVIVIGGGGAVDAGLAGCLPDGAPVVAADSGVDAAAALGVHVDVVVGDLDSASPEALAAAEAAGARVERHPADKDATDLALALDCASTLLDGEGAGDVVVAGVEGGRLDHLLAGILALGDPDRRRLRIRAHLGRATIHVVHGPGSLAIERATGQLLSLLPVGGDALGVRTGGLRFPLMDERLPSGTTRGVSNVVDHDPASVTLESGTLLVVLPGEAA